MFKLPKVDKGVPEEVHERNYIYSSSHCTLTWQFTFILDCSYRIVNVLQDVQQSVMDLFFSFKQNFALFEHDCHIAVAYTLIRGLFDYTFFFTVYIKDMIQTLNCVVCMLLFF